MSKEQAAFKRDGKVWSHPIFGSIKPSLRNNKASEQAWQDFKKQGRYVSPTGTFAQYHFLRCMQEGIPCKIETVKIDDHWWYLVEITSGEMPDG